MNLSGSGVGWTLGPRGASVGIGKRGARLNTSLAGFSSSHRLTGGARSGAAASPPAPTTLAVTCAVDDTGLLTFCDAQGHPLSEAHVDAAKKQNRDAILGLIQLKCDEINQAIDELGRLHWETPDSAVRPVFVPDAFETPEPPAPQFRQPSWWDRLFKKRVQRMAEANVRAEADYVAAYQGWCAAREQFKAAMLDRQQWIEERIYTQPEAMAAWLEETLQDIAWPRETTVAFEVLEDGRTLVLDVDLPEIEDMPNRTADVPSRGLKLSVKYLSPTRLQRLYMAHVHGIAFRLIGESFAALPLAETVVLSGYSQRRDPATGRLRDDYLYSVKVSRDDWDKVDFTQLPSVDVVEALGAFELRRQMSKTGVFKSIEPFVVQ